MCSACLLGFACRYDGKAKTDERIVAMVDQVTFVPFCPEQMGGLSTPRLQAEERDGRIVDAEGHDVTENYERGAAAAVAMAKLSGAKRAIMRIKSPSCGVGQVFDGTFSDSLRPGDGVTTRALKAAGVEVISQQS